MMFYVLVLFWLKIDVSQVERRIQIQIRLSEKGVVTNDNSHANKHEMYDSSLKITF